MPVSLSPRGANAKKHRKRKTYVSLITRYIDTVLHLCVQCLSMTDAEDGLETVSSRRVWRDLMKLAETPSAGSQRANHPIYPDSFKICQS